MQSKQHCCLAYINLPVSEQSSEQPASCSRLAGLTVGRHLDVWRGLPVLLMVVVVVVSATDCARLFNEHHLGQDDEKVADVGTSKLSGLYLNMISGCCCWSTGLVRRAEPSRAHRQASLINIMRGASHHSQADNINDCGCF